MANKRVSELTQITVPELNVADLLLISDIVAYESKKLTLGDLSSFLFGNGITGSLSGTASYALMATSASYVLISSSSYAPTASWAQTAATTSYAVSTISSSYSATSSYVATASYVFVSTAQTAYSASFAGNAQTASYLQFNPNGNGTASYALTASYFGLTQVSISYATTAAYSPYSDTASIALNSITATTASYVPTASFLFFDGINPNGTASYALVAASNGNQAIDYGTFTAITQSVSASQIDSVTINSPLGGLQQTTAEAFGTVMVQFTSSAAPTNGKIELFAVDRALGYSRSLDSSPIYWYGGGGSNVSGTLKYPFSLCGTSLFNGIYEFYVTASNGAFIENSRTTRFRFSSTAQNFNVAPAELTQFYAYPSNGILFYSSSINPGNVYQGSASQVIFSGSADATVLLVPPNTLNTMYYTWTLSNLTTLIADGNYSLTSFGGVPAGIISMSISNCNFSALTDLSTSSLAYLNCSNNSIAGIPNLPPSMSYFNCSNNISLNLPARMPEGLITFIGNYLSITHTPIYFPDTVQSMSVANCINLNTGWSGATLPASLIYFDCHSSPLTSLPAIPSNCVYLNVANCQFGPGFISGFASNLVTSGKSNGYFNIFNNPGSASAAGIVTNIGTLVSRGWTVIS